MKHLIKALALSGAVAALAPLAHATTISIGLQQAGQSSITTVATDSTTAGYAAWSGTFGSFNFNSVSGTGAPIMSQGTLDTTSLQVSSNLAAGTSITVYITEQGLTSPNGLTDFASGFTSNAFGGNAVSVEETTLFGNSNQLYAGVQLRDKTYTGIDSSSVLDNTKNITGPYSETAEYIVTVGAGSSSVNDTIDLTATAATPEPSSLILLGTGALGAAGMLRRRFTGKSNA